MNLPLLPRMFAVAYLKTFSATRLGSSFLGTFECFKERTFEKLSMSSMVRGRTSTKTPADLLSILTLISPTANLGFRVVTWAASFALSVARCQILCLTVLIHAYFRYAVKLSRLVFSNRWLAARGVAISKILFGSR